MLLGVPLLGLFGIPPLMYGLLCGWPAVPSHWPHQYRGSIRAGIPASPLMQFRASWKGRSVVLGKVSTDQVMGWSWGLGEVYVGLLYSHRRDYPTGRVAWWGVCLGFYWHSENISGMLMRLSGAQWQLEACTFGEHTQTSAASDTHDLKVNLESWVNLEYLIGPNNMLRWKENENLNLRK